METDEGQRLKVNLVLLATTAIAKLFKGEVVSIDPEVQASWGLEPLD
jgi:hypothetical protein